jgi:integrative and conjugative element protein (TIGR02256 family)
MAEDRACLFSADQPQINPTQVGSHIEHALRELHKCSAGEVRCHAWNQQYVAAAFSVRVDLPSRGTVDGVDVRREEPLLLLFHRHHYPSVAPIALSDRKDFPADKLPHLNPVATGHPAWFCLIRGDLNDWFAEHTIADFVQRVRGWLRDAAAGMLIPEDDYFEATRLAEARGNITFGLRDLELFAAQEWSESAGRPWFAFFSAETPSEEVKLDGRDGSLSLRVLSWHQKKENLARRLREFEKFNDQADAARNAHRRCFGIVCGSSNMEAVLDYFGRLPQDLPELLDFCRGYGIPLDEAIREYVQRRFSAFSVITVVIAILRPQKLIDSHSTIEPICFLINTSDLARIDQAPPNATVYALFHRFPLDPEKAAEISGLELPKLPARSLLFGCGALGSKLAMHRARSGETALTAVDPAIISPHNTIRHGLTGDYVGMNKASAIKAAIERLYGAIPQDQRPLGYAGSALDWLQADQHQRLDEHHLLIDATASVMILDAICQAHLPKHLKVVRCGIADAGRVGLMAVEGRHRNPRVDDLNVLMYDRALERPIISQWLKRDNRQKAQRLSLGFAEIPIGLGCSSTTFKLPDDLVSLHAAHFSIAIRELAEDINGQQSGHLILNYFQPGVGATNSEDVPVAPVIVLQASGAPGWQIRIQAQAVEEIRERLTRAAPNETGGLMIGTAHLKRRIIYVTRIVDAPPDSAGSPSSFRRGTRDLPEVVNEIHEATGGLLGFVGDWHTHPRGSGNISPTDIAAMQRTKRKFDTAGLPTFILIATQKGFRAYVSERV